MSDIKQNLDKDSMNNKNKNSGFIKNSFLWVIMVIVAVVGFQYFVKGVGTETVDKISYTTLVKKLEAGDIKELSLIHI